MLAFLSLVRSCGLPFARLDEAIVVIADWLSANRLDDEWGVNWPTAVPLEEVESAADSQLRPRERSDWTGGPSRSAWCYGSPGVARSLWLAGQALDRPDYRDLAVSAMEAVFRRPVPARMIDSPTFCHGVAGLLAIALRFARETQSPLFVMESQKLVDAAARRVPAGLTARVSQPRIRGESDRSTRPARWLRVSVVITTKNRRDELRSAISSALTQSVQPELLVIDDGSTDGTAEMVLSGISRSSFGASEMSLGYIVQRNRAARLVSGEIIFSLDDDAEFSTPYVVEQTLRILTIPASVRWPCLMSSRRRSIV